MGEDNIIGLPYDSTFFAFFTDAATADEFHCRLDNEKIASYVSKKQYINMMDNYFVEIGTFVGNWPLRISWNKKDFQDFNIAQYLGTDMQFVFTNFHPFNGYPDFPCCYKSVGLTVLSDTTEIIIDKNNSCQYITNYSKDSISLLYVGSMYKYTSVKDFSAKTYRCWYNESLHAVSIQNTNGSMPSKVEIFNLWGLKVLDKQISSNNETQLNINISYLPNGLYFTRVYQFKNNYLNSTFKIIKR